MRFLIFTLFLLASFVQAAELNSKVESRLDKTPDGQHVPLKIGPGLTHMYFDQWAGPEILVYVYVPWQVDPTTAPIMFMMHGAKRNGARYLSEWDEIAEENGFIVIAPEFDKKNFPKSAHYNRGNVFDGDNGKKPEEEWTFSAIELLFDHVVASIGGQQKEYSLYGHSAGSQFTHRFLFFKPDARVKRYMPANAGWYTYADLSIDYPYGLKGTGVTEDQLIAALQKDVVILLGDKDSDPKHESLRRSKGAMKQGAHRFARGLGFMKNARENAEKYGVELGWKVRIIKDIAHSNGGVAAKAGDLIE